MSTQQVRNLEAAGVLPEAPRTPTGYRRYSQRHLDALLTYQALAAGHGLDVAQGVMRAVYEGEVQSALALIDASHASLHEQRRALNAAEKALEALAGEAPDSGAIPRSGMRVGDLARFLGVRTSALRVWESAGLLLPAREPGTGYRWYTATDVRDARIIQLLRQGRYLFTHIRPVLDDLRHTGGTDALRAAVAERRAALNRRARAMLAAAGRLEQFLGQPGQAPDGP